MTTSTIFCPTSHLILSAARCPKCDWQRPPLGRVGEPAWQVGSLKAGFGGLGRHVFVGPAAAQGVLALPMSNREIVGLDLLDGKERWRISPGEGLITRQLVGDGNTILMALSDERTSLLDPAGPGQLARLDPLTGKFSVLWQGGHQLTTPACSETHIVISAAGSELVALRRGPTLEVAWRVPLETFWAVAPPHIANGNVFVCDGLAMQGQGWLKVFDLHTGQPVWNKPTQGLVSHPLVSSAGQIIFQNGKKRLVAWDAASGRETWSLDFDKFYTAPIAGDRRAFLVARGEASRDSAEHYLLKALDPASGKLLWEAPLPARVLAAPLWAGGRVYVASEDGRLLAFRDQDGGQVFVQSIGSDEDPPRTALLAAEGLLVAGTYSGKVTALQVEEPRQELEAPEAYLGRSEFELAAVALALRGDFAQSGRLYAEELHDIAKALALYEHAKLFHEAAELCAQQGLLAEAEKYYKQIGDLPKQAEMLLKRGDELGAARLFEKIGQVAMAAALFEKAGEFHDALGLYQGLNDEQAILRVHRLMPPDFQRAAQVVERLLQQGRVTEAAEEALGAGLLEKAAELFKQTKLPTRELDTLLVLVQKKPEDWVSGRIAELARSAGRFLDEAQALERLNYPRRTAEAYQRAAMQAANDTIQAADLYKKAAYYFGECGSEIEEAACRDTIARLLRTPIVQIQGNTTKEFTEYRWNTLELTIHNRGYGAAKEVRWYVSQEHFDVDEITAVWIFPHLGVDVKKDVRVSVRPKRAEAGDAVPFTIQWAWENTAGQKFQGKISVFVPVKGEHDSRPTGQPVIIQSGATFVQTEKYVAGDDIAGGQKGDNVIIGKDRRDGIPNSQKGDRMEIDRDGLRITTNDRRMETAPRACPNCKLPNDPDAKFCVHCQQALEK